jgi:hypothetical protein
LSELIPTEPDSIWNVAFQLQHLAQQHNLQSLSDTYFLIGSADLHRPDMYVMELCNILFLDMLLLRAKRVWRQSLNIKTRLFRELRYRQLQQRRNKLYRIVVNKLE